MVFFFRIVSAVLDHLDYKSIHFRISLWFSTEEHALVLIRVSLNYFLFNGIFPCFYNSDTLSWDRFGGISGLKKGAGLDCVSVFLFILELTKCLQRSSCLWIWGLSVYCQGLSEFSLAGPWVAGVGGRTSSWGGPGGWRSHWQVSEYGSSHSLCHRECRLPQRALEVTHMCHMTWAERWWQRRPGSSCCREDICQTRGEEEGSWQQGLWKAAPSQAPTGCCLPRIRNWLSGSFRMEWYTVGFRALAADVIRLEAVTLGGFTLNLIFIVSWNGNCFLPVNKVAGVLLYNECG